MLNELKQSIAISQGILSFLGPAKSCLAADTQPHTTRVLTEIASTAITRMNDSRVSDTLNSKLHALTVAHFQNACMSLRETHARMDVASLRAVALQLRATYTHLYERQILKLASSRHKATPTDKQPYANDILLYAFEKSQNPSRREREVLASITGLTVEQVRVWFQNRRSRTKKKAPELQSRQPLQLSDVLDSVRATRKAAHSSDVTMDVPCDNDNDSGYCSGSDDGASACCQLLVRREPVVLSIESTTLRSYPAPYIPQSSRPSAQFAPPLWTRRPAILPSAPTSTVTVDELARSMERLSLRPRRVTPGSSCSTTPATNIVSAEASAKKSKPKPTRKDGRKVAGARRAVSGLSDSHTNPATPSALASPSSLTAALSDTSPKRKKSGPPRRKPIGKALARQASDLSLAPTSSSSSDSSRSTSYASDFSLNSVASDFSLTSVESVQSAEPASYPPCSDLHAFEEPVCFDIGLLLASGNGPQHVSSTDIPVYDFTSTSYDPSSLGGPAPEVAALLGDPEMQNLLQDAQAQYHPRIHGPPISTTTSGQSTFDVGLANMGSLLDFNSAAFPTLEALLSDGIGFYSNLLQQSRHNSPKNLSLCAQPRDHTWVSVGLSGLA